MSTFLDNISTVINWLFNQLSSLTTSLSSNYIFIIIIAVFLFSVVINIILSFIHINKNKGSDD